MLEMVRNGQKRVSQLPDLLCAEAGKELEVALEQLGKGFLEQTAKTQQTADVRQVAFRKGVTCHKDPRFVGGPHLEQLVDQPSFIGGRDARKQSHCGLPDGTGERVGVGLCA